MENLDRVVYTELFTLAISLWRIFFSNLVLLFLWRTLKVEHLLISYLDLSRSFHGGLQLGSGTNYQLGTGNAHVQKLPCKIDSLQGSYIKLVSAAKFHSVAIGASREVYTWGFGRGWRLGHPDFDIHSEGDSFDLRKKLPFCAGLLLRLLKKDLRVFVTCTTGFDRSPSLYCCILALDAGHCPSRRIQFRRWLTPMQA